MDLLLAVVKETLWLLWQVLPTMFAGLFGVEILMQIGLMQKLEPLGKPLADASRLPPQSVLAFLTAIGSLMAAHAMLARHHAENVITGRELVLGAVFNTVPLHFKETLTFQLPVILPLLGPRLCLIYIAVFWLSGFLKLGYVLYLGRKTLPPRAVNSTRTDPADLRGPARKQKTITGVLHGAFNARWPLFFRMARVLLVVTLIMQVLVHAGVLGALNHLVGPLTSPFGLPPTVIAPVSVYIVSPIAGISAMSALLKQQLITEYQAIVALLVGGFLMVPVTRLRGTGPRYVSILGWTHGLRVLSITTILSLVARGIVLAGVLMFFR